MKAYLQREQHSAIIGVGVLPDLFPARKALKFQARISQKNSRHMVVTKGADVSLIKDKAKVHFRLRQNKRIGKENLYLNVKLYDLLSK